MSILGKLEVSIKINVLPHNAQIVKNNWREFMIYADGQVVKMRVRPRVWYKMEKAANEYSSWVASITGKMGQRIKDGFILLDPKVQVYEIKINSSVQSDQTNSI